MTKYGYKTENVYNPIINKPFTIDYFYSKDGCVLYFHSGGDVQYFLVNQTVATVLLEEYSNVPDFESREGVNKLISLIEDNIPETKIRNDMIYYFKHVFNPKEVFTCEESTLKHYVH